MHHTYYFIWLLSVLLVFFLQRFFELLKTGQAAEVDVMLQDEHFKNFMVSQEQLSLAFVQVVLLNNTNLIDILLKHGVDANTCDCMFNENGIMQAARFGHSDMILYLIKLGVNVNHQSDNGNTALHVAIENMHHRCLQVLVQQPAIDLNIKDCSGYSPLMWTARLRDWRGMKILIEAGCNIESKDFTKGVNALHIVVDSERAFWKGAKATFEDSDKCIALLASAGIDINAGDIYKNTPLLYAIRSTNVRAVKTLLKLNCRFTATQRVGSAFSGTSFYFNDDGVIGSNPSLLPLYVALSKLNVATAKMLCLAGIEYHKLSQEPLVIEYVANVYPPLGELLQKLVHNPVSLQQVCRSKIRRCVGSKITGFRSAKLDLPVSLVNYICLDDLDALATQRGR